MGPELRVALAKLAVLVGTHRRCRTRFIRRRALGRLAVLDPELLQRDAELAQLAMHPLEVNRGPLGRLVAAQDTEQPPLDVVLAELTGRRPVKARGLGTRE